MNSQTLVSKIIGLSVALVLITSTLVGSVYYWSYGKDLKEQKFEATKKEANLLTPLLENHYKKIEEDLKLLQNFGVLKKMFFAPIGEIRREMDQLATGLINARSDLYSITLIEPENKQILYSLDQESALKLYQDAVYRDGKEWPKWFLQQEEERLKKMGFEQFNDPQLNFKKIYDQPYYITPIHLLRNNKQEVSGKRLPVNKVFFAVRGKLGNAKENSILGYVCLTYQLRDLFRAIDSEKGPHKELYLTNRQGEYLMHPDSEKTFAFEFGKNQRIYTDFVTTGQFFKDGSVKETTVYPQLAQSEQIIHLKKIQISGLKGEEDSFLVLGLQLLHDNSLQNFRNVRRESIIYALCFAGLVAIGAYYYTRYITRNLNKIARAAKDYAEGKTQVDIFVNSNDEIGTLATTFAHLIHNINERTKRLKKSEERSRRAKEFAEEMSKTKTLLLRNVRQQKSQIENFSKEKDDLLAVVSHDLKNPLAVIESSMNLLMEEENSVHLPDVARDLIRRSRNSAKFALNLITDLLDLARLEGGMKLVLDSTNISKLINECAENFHLMAKDKAIKLVTEFDDHYQLKVDKSRLAQVINNIIGNAIKFTPTNGQITIKNYLKKEDNTEWIYIAIADTGRGIPTDKLEFIFDKFQQAQSHDREIGTGLGLAICKNIAKLHSGDVSVQSEVGKGSTFFIKIPYLEGKILAPNTTVEQSLPAITPPPIQLPPDGINLAGKTVLLVDDSADAVEVLRLKLLKHQANVLYAENGQAALEIIETLIPSLIVLDLEMPVMNGIETLGHIRRKHSAHALPVMIYSSKATKETVDFFKLEANTFANKRDKMDSVLLKINGLINRGEILKDVSKIADTNPPQFSTIALIDDSEDIHQLFRIFLKTSGHNIVHAENIQQGLQKVQENAAIDLIFLDMNLPDGLGADFLQQARNKIENLPPIIGITGSISENDLQENLKLGFCEIIDKRINKARLLELISKHQRKSKATPKAA